MPRGVYIVRMDRVAVTAAITLIQVKAGANAAIRIMEAKVGQHLSTTSTELSVQINRKSAAATVTSFTPILTSPNDAAAQSVGGTTATGTNASAEGTDTDIIEEDVWNYLTGWYWQDANESHEIIPGGIFGLKFPVAPGASVTITAMIKYREIP